MDARFPEKIDSKFRYVLVSARRAEQLIRGGRPRLDDAGKPTTLAMEEISRDLVDWDYGPAPQKEPAAAGLEAAGEGEAAEAVEEVH